MSYELFFVCQIETQQRQCNIPDYLISNLSSQIKILINIAVPLFCLSVYFVKNALQLANSLFELQGF